MTDYRLKFICPRVSYQLITLLALQTVQQYIKCLHVLAKSRSDWILNNAL